MLSAVHLNLTCRLAWHRRRGAPPQNALRLSDSSRPATEERGSLQVQRYIEQPCSLSRREPLPQQARQLLRGVLC